MNVVAYGGGVDSTAMLIRLVLERAPLKAILFADTGGECARTYSYIQTISAWLNSKNYPSVTTVKNIPSRGPNKGQFISLFASLWKNQSLPPVAFNCHTCSERFKIRPQHRWISLQPWAQEAWDNGQRITNFVGFELGEEKRAARTYRNAGHDQRFKIAYPLIDWKWDRNRCILEIKKAGLPDPGKSACFFCPNRKENEIRALRSEEPEKFKLALELEARALASGKIKDPKIKGLGRRFRWSDVA